MKEILYMSLKKDSHQKVKEGGIRAPFFIYSNTEINIKVNNALGNYFYFASKNITAKVETQHTSITHKLNNDLIEPIW